MVNRAGVNLDSGQKRVRLENHASRHSSSYHNAVKNRLEEAWNRLYVRTPENARKAFDRVVDENIEDIRNGTLKPYDNKDVRFIEVVEPSRRVPSKNSGLSRRVGPVRRPRPPSLGRLNGFLDLIGPVFLSAHEMIFMRQRMNSGRTFGEALRDLQREYDRWRLPDWARPDAY